MDFPTVEIEFGVSVGVLLDSLVASSSPCSSSQFKFFLGRHNLNPFNPYAKW